MPADLAAEVAAAGLMRMLVPSTLGGPEAHPVEMIESLELLGVANPSAAWCAMISSTTSVLAGWLEPGPAAEVFGDPLGIWGGGFAPTGIAKPTDSGLRVDGRWSFGSGAQNCTWLVGGTIGEDATFRLCFVPAGDVEIVENWDVVGLRGTGSHDWAVTGAEVDTSLTIPIFDRTAIATTPLYQMPIFGLLASGIAAVALGIGRGAIDDLVELAGGKIPTLDSRRLAASPAVQAEVARHTAGLAAAGAGLRAAASSAFDEAAAGEPASMDTRALLRIAATHAVTTAAGVATAMYTLGGGTSVRNDSPLAGRVRDALATTQHVMVAPSILEPCGKVLLGLPVDRPDL